MTPFNRAGVYRRVPVSRIARRVIYLAEITDNYFWSRDGPFEVKRRPVDVDYTARERNAKSKADRRYAGRGLLVPPIMRVGYVSWTPVNFVLPSVADPRRWN